MERCDFASVAAIIRADLLDGNFKNQTEFVPESVKLDFQNMLSRQRYFAKASNYPKQVTNSEKGEVLSFS